MSAIAKIRDGIIEGDWISVVEGYNTMTGSELVVPEQYEEIKDSIYPDIIASVIKILDDAGLLGEEIALPVVSEKEDKEKIEPEKTQPRKRGRKKGSKNRNKKNKDDDAKFIEEEGETNSVIGSTNKMRFITTDPTPADIALAEKTAEMGSNKDRRSPDVNEGKCSDCSKKTVYVVKSQDSTEFLCNSCQIKRKGK